MTATKTNGNEGDMGQKVEKRRGPRIRLSGQTSEGVSGGIRGSESLKDFRDLTDGLSNRLELPSLEAMRAGAVNNPISLAYLEQRWNVPLNQFVITMLKDILTDRTYNKS